MKRALIAAVAALSATAWVATPAFAQRPDRGHDRGEHADGDRGGEDRGRGWRGRGGDNAQPSQGDQGQRVRNWQNDAPAATPPPQPQTTPPLLGANDGRGRGDWSGGRGRGGDDGANDGRGRGDWNGGRGGDDGVLDGRGRGDWSGGRGRGGDDGANDGRGRGDWNGGRGRGGDDGILGGRGDWNGGRGDHNGGRGDHNGGRGEWNGGRDFSHNDWGHDRSRDRDRYRRWRHNHHDWDRPRYHDWRGVRHGYYFDRAYALIISGFFGHNYYWHSYDNWRRPYRHWRVGDYLPDYVWWEPIPYDLYYRLPPAPYGCRYIMVDRDILLIVVRSGLILDAMYYY